MRLNGLAQRAQVFDVLRYRDFRLFWVGHAFSVSGIQMVMVTQWWLIWKLTGSELLLGSLGLAEALPAVFLSLFGGVVADKVDLRRFLIILQVVVATALFLLATLTATEVVRVWHLFAFTFVFGMHQAFDQPSRQAIFPHLLDRRDLMKAVSLNSIVWPGTRIFGPAVAGIIIDRVGAVAGAPLAGAAAVFYLAFIAFLLFGFFMSLVRVPTIERARGGNVVQDIGDGIKYIWRQRLFTLLIGMTFMGSFFVSSHMGLLPVFATDILGGDGTTLGSLFAVGGIGSLFGALVAANLTNFRRRGLLIIGGAGAQAMFVMLFAASNSYGLSLVLVFLAGVGFSLFSVSTQSTLQLLVPDELRGRVMSIWGMTYGVVMPLGRAQMGASAGLFRTHMSGSLGRYAGAPASVMLGGLVMLLFVFLGVGSSRRIRSLDPQKLEAREPAASRA